MMAKANDSPIYQLHISIHDTHPPIWRRVQVRGNSDLKQLHDIIQVLFGWEGYHLHMFEINGVSFTDDRESRMELEMRDENRMRLDRLNLQEGMKFTYTYDFGDDWVHDIKVEKILPADPTGAYPVCLKGKRAGPPEDCGGVWGYAEIVEILAMVARGEIQAPGGDENEDEEEPAQEGGYDQRLELLEWVGPEFDPEAFDLDAINAALKRFQK